jgi:hypothetical protein
VAATPGNYSMSEPERSTTAPRLWQAAKTARSRGVLRARRAGNPRWSAGPAP